MFQCVTPDGLLCLLGMNSPSHNIYRGSRLPLWLLGGLGQVQSYRLRGKKEKGKRGTPPPHGTCLLPQPSTRMVEARK